MLKIKTKFKIKSIWTKIVKEKKNEVNELQLTNEN